MGVDDDAAEGGAGGEPQRESGVGPGESLGEAGRRHQSLGDGERGDEGGRHREARDERAGSQQSDGRDDGAGDEDKREQPREDDELASERLVPVTGPEGQPSHE